MRHIGPKLHKFIHGFGKKTDHSEVKHLYGQISRRLAKHNVLAEAGRNELVMQIVRDVAESLQLKEADTANLYRFVARLFDYEELFLLPDIDFSIERSVSEYWELKDELNQTNDWLDKFTEIIDAITSFALKVFSLLSPTAQSEDDLQSTEALKFMVKRLDHLDAFDERVEAIMAAAFDEEIEHLKILTRTIKRLETNLVVASGGNPADVTGFTRQVKSPTKSDIKNADRLIATYLSGTPLADIFDGEDPFLIPTRARYEHQHIVAGTGHGKTQALQYLIAQDLKEVERGERSIVVIDSQGDLINKLRNLKCFAPCEPLHDRICIINPEDIEYPVSLNLFDVGQDRLKDYEPLQREQLTNSILELYDFVLGSLLEAEMTQKQQVLFNFVTKLMLEIPGATIKDFRKIFAAQDASEFMDAVNRLDETSKQFFLTEFKERDFAQTKSQVNRRLLGILGDRNFERMFSHPKSKFDLFTEMNAGKVILINTSKRLLKASGSELLGHFFIALISQAAQERAVIPEGKRMPTFVYIDEAADYFDRNIEMILREARKYKVGMILAHQYLGQLDTKLQDAFAANTTIKFAGGVSSKDASTLARQMNTDADTLERQPKLSFATFVKGSGQNTASLTIPYGVVENMATMSESDANILRDMMREKYATKWPFQNSEEKGEDDQEVGAEPGRLKAKGKRKKRNKHNPKNQDTPDTDASDEF